MFPILQVIHVSDLHFAGSEDDGARRRASRRLLHRLESCVGGAMRERIEQGLQGEDPNGVRALEGCLARIAPVAREFPENWLVVSGDRLATALRARPYVAYGNHDVWAERFP